MLRCSKRDVSAAARVIREERLDAATVEALSDAEAERLINPPKEPKPKDDSYLQPDYDALVERKAKNRKLPVKLMWIEYCEQAAGLEKRAYVYQTFCEYFAEAEEKAAQLTRQELERAGADCEVLKQNARGRLERAAQLIVGRVVER